MAKARRRFSIEQVRSLWELWKAGHTLEETSTALGVSMGGVHRIVDARGAVRTAEHFEDLALYAVLVDDLTWSTPRWNGSPGQHWLAAATAGAPSRARSRRGCSRRSAPEMRVDPVDPPARHVALPHGIGGAVAGDGVDDEPRLHPVVLERVKE